MAGYYDPRDGRLRVVEGAGTGTRVLEEMILAHELTHALEDQRFGLEIRRRPPTTARWRARRSTRGAPTALMYAYVGEHFSAEETLGGLLGSAFQDTGDLPPFLQAQVLFAVRRRRGVRRASCCARGGGWALVDTAYEVRPPVLDRADPAPGRLLRRRRAASRSGSAPGVLGAGWKRAHAGTWGELQTRELLGGSSREPRPAGAATATSCGGRGDDAALIMRWRWDTPRDEAEFETPAARGDRRSRRSACAVAATVTLAVAPDRDLAERLAGS